MRTAAVVACVSALSACGGGAGQRGPSDLAGGVDGAAPAPDAAPDHPSARDTRLEVPAAEDARRDAIPVLEDAMLIGPCGVPGAKCPTYLGSTVWMLQSSFSQSASVGPDGAIYVGGTIDNTFDFDPTQAMDVHGTDGRASAFLMKLGPTGAYVSTFTIEGDDFGSPSMGAPAVTANASFVPGYFEGTVDLDPGPGVDMYQDLANRGGTFVSKFDAAGKYLWGRVLVSTDSGIIAWGWPVAMPDGGVVLTGNYAGPGDLDPGPAVLAPPNQNGAFVTRLDASGKQLWVRTLGGDSCISVGMSAALDAGGVLWLSGTASGSGCALDQNGPPTPDPNGFFVASMTLDGKLRTFGTVMGGSDLAGPPVVAHDGSIYLAGSVGPSGAGQQGPIDVDPSPAVSTRVVPATGLEFVMKLDHDGKLLWLQPVDVHIESFALTSDDGLILAADPDLGPGGMSILELDAAGHETWRLHVGSATRPTAVLVNANGLFVLGDQDGTGDLDPSPGVDSYSSPIVFLSRYTF
jgi:hypothetical protein